MPEIQPLTPWMPVIGTLLGALLGLGASFLIAYFNKSAQEASSRNERDRLRLERIYELLISIRTDLGNDLGEIINWVHYNKEMPNKDINGIPPLIELEMMVSLYFPSLEINRLSLMKSIHAFSKELIEHRFSDHKNEQLKKKQAITEGFLKLIESADNNIIIFKLDIAKLIKA